MSVLRRPRARIDLLEIADHFDQIDPSLSERFLLAVEQTLANLERMPRMGSPFPLNNPRLQGLRHQTVKGFPNHLIFYLVDGNQIEVVRILHGARDIDNLLGG